MFLGLRTVIYPATDLAATKAWFTDLIGHGPYFDQPAYVGFDVGGYELGLTPASEPTTGPAVVETYWGVRDVDVALARLVEAGARLRHPVQDVGEGIRMAGVLDPDGSFVGIIENPHFRLPPDDR